MHIIGRCYCSIVSSNEYRLGLFCIGYGDRIRNGNLAPSKALWVRTNLLIVYSISCTTLSLCNRPSVKMSILRFLQCILHFIQVMVQEHRRIITLLWPYLIVLVAFAIFIVKNGGSIVIGKCCMLC